MKPKHIHLAIILALSAFFASPVGAAIRINEFMAANATTLTDSSGRSSDWIELYNSSASNVTLTGWYLTDNAADLTKWKFPSVTHAGLDYLLIFASGEGTVIGNEIHTTFQLASGGEYIALVAPNGVDVIHEFSPEYPPQVTDVSFGLGPLDDARFFTNATPGAANTVGAEEFVADTKFDPDRGFYTNPVSVTISSATTGATIYITTDFTQPTTNSMVYTGPLTLTNTTCLRAMAAQPGLYPSDADTHTYIFLHDVLTQTTEPPAFPDTWNGTSPDYAMDPRIVTNSVYGARIQQGLLSIPSLSIVTEMEHFFDSNTGIYTHPGSQGVAWERPISFELINPDGTKGFQLNAGLRIYGGAFRGFNLSLKKSFRVLFKAEYGATKLKHELFDADTATSTFDTLILRAGGNDGWNFWGGTQTQYVTDEFMRRMHLAMGQPAGHGTFTHLYINGLYWGLYNLVERPDASFSGTYFGGTEDNWDGLNSGSPTGESNNQTWNAMLAQVRAGLADNTAYQKIQGKHPDRTANTNYTDLLDVDNYIDYMLANLWGGTGDWPGKNYYVGCRRPPDSTGFKSYMWDAEGAISTVRSSLTTDITGVGTGVAEPYAALKQNDEFLLRFADHVHAHLFGDGALSPLVVSNIYREATTFIEDAIVAESARWGDMKVNTLRTPDTWETKRDYVQSTYMPQRTAIVLNILRNADLYPDTDAPVFNSDGGSVTNGFMLTMAASDPVYYTVDGTDPRQYGTSAAVGTLYTGTIPVSQSVQVRARALGGSDTWSALAEVTLTPTVPNTLRLTELMYNPRQPDALESGAGATETHFEFIEFQNRSAETIGLADLRLEGGVQFDFSTSDVRTLAPGAFVLIVRDLEAFKARYPHWATYTIAGEYQTFDAFPVATLSDSGETLTLRDTSGNTLITFTYNDARDWPQGADGTGHSLVPTELITQSEGALDYSGFWRASAFIDGSPGEVDPVMPQTIVLNEILTHTDFDEPGFPDYDSNDGIELYNASGQSVTNTNWYLSDTADDLSKWPVPSARIPAPGAWSWFEEVYDFHTPITNGFGLSKDGETVFLSHLPGGGSNRVVDVYRFKGQLNGISKGRYPDGTAAWMAMRPTTNAANVVTAPSVRISEIMYHPPSPSTTNNTRDEYVEILNPTESAVALWSEAGPWRIAGGIRYTFPTNTTLSPNEYVILVSFDPVLDTAARSAFQTLYALTNGQARLFGPFSGQLDNRTERVGLEMPQLPDAPSTATSWIIVDEVVYFDRLPWPEGTDGTGSPLQRRSGISSGMLPQNWFNGFVATPGLPGTPLAILSPAHAQRYFAPDSVPITVSLDEQAITLPVRDVRFYDGSTLLCIATQAPFTCSLNMPTARMYVLSATLTHAGGTVTSRQSVVSALNIDMRPSTDIAEESAALRAELSGGALANVSFFWGTSDGGTNASAWDDVAFVTDPTNGIIHRPITGLNPGDPYYVRALAQADGRQSWATGTVTFTTLSFDAWPYSMPIHFSGAGAAALAGFPVLVKLHEGLPGFSYSQFASSNAFGLRFADDETGQRLAYQIETWDITGTSIVWVATDSLTSNTVIRAYWGASASSAPGYTENGEAWPSFEAVWHSGSPMSDATARNRDVSENGAALAPGIIGPSLQFDATNHRIANGPPRTWYGQHMNGLTVSMWLHPDTGNANRSVAWGASSNAVDNLYIDMNTSPFVRRWRLGIGNSSHSLERYQLDQWQYLALVVSNGQIYATFNDDLPVAVATVAPFTPSSPLTLGGRDGPLPYFLGRIDELRMAPSARSAAWLRAEYDTVARHSSFATYGPVELSATGPDQDGDGIPDAWENQFPLGLAITPGGNSDADTLTNYEEFIAGTDPTNSASTFMLEWAVTNASPHLRLFTYAATGNGYDGVSRYYAMEYTPGLSVTQGWVGLPGLTNVPGTDQWLTHTNILAEERFFYRARTWLSPSGH